MAFATTRQNSEQNLGTETNCIRYLRENSGALDSDQAREKYREDESQQSVIMFYKQNEV